VGFLGKEAEGASVFASVSSWTLHEVHART
jgi:hypothetical protein